MRAAGVSRATEAKAALSWAVEDDFWPLSMNDEWLPDDATLRGMRRASRAQAPARLGKSLWPMVERLGGEADYDRMQQFSADSPWVAALVVRAVARRVVPAIDVQAWVLDDTGFVRSTRASG